MKEKTSASESQDWRKALVEIVLKILTIGLYHIKKHRGGSGTETPQS